MRKVTVTRMREGYAQTALTFRITYVDALVCIVSVLTDIRNLNPGMHIQYAATVQIFPLCKVLLK
jgi:hypothetical protein